MTFAVTSKPQSQKATPTKRGAKPMSVPKKPVFGQPPGFGFRFPEGAIAPTIQPKLKIGEPNDKYEQEADRVADEVMRMPDSAITGTSGLSKAEQSSRQSPGTTPPFLQRQCSEYATDDETTLQRSPLPSSIKHPKISALNGSLTAQFQKLNLLGSEPQQTTPVAISEQTNSPRLQRFCSECEEQVQRQPVEDEDEELLQAKEMPNGTPQVSSNLSNQINAIRGGGQPLPTSVRAFVEPRFGRNFSSVRLHTSSDAVALASSLQARAFTVGHDIFFGRGEFQPDTREGQRLLTHELTHTVQQSSQSSRHQGSDTVIQRFITCEGSEACPSREPGEIGRSSSEPMELFEMTSGGIGMLISNFAVGASSIRGDLTTNPGWNSFVSAIAAHSNMTWEILGFTDCQGSESRNTSLRTARATELYLALPDDAMAQVDTYGGASLTDCIRDNASERNRRLNRSAIIRQKSVSYEFEPEIVEGNASRTVYMCSKPLDTSPVGNHAFFRFDSPAPGNDTLSLQPIQVIPAGDCWQGIPDWNYPSDRSAPGSCDITAIRYRDLIREFNAYPIGHYCTWGPNSNTFVGHLARRTGIPNPDPPGTTPGIDASPPPSGTYAPNKWVTLRGCETKICIPDAMGTDVMEAEPETIA